MGQFSRQKTYRGLAYNRTKSVPPAGLVVLTLEHVYQKLAKVVDGEVSRGSGNRIEYQKKGSDLSPVEGLFRPSTSGEIRVCEFLMGSVRCV